MNTTEIDDYFHFHNSNMRLLKIGFEEVRNQIKILHLKRNKINCFIYNLEDSDSEKNEIKNKEISLSRILSGIQVSWAEESIKRLFYEKNLLSDVQREHLLEQPLEQKWFKTLKIIFCIAYDLVPIGDEICSIVEIERQRNNLGLELVSHYLELRKIISEYLVPNFAIRNKVQHGEWAYAFRPRYSKEFSQELTDMLNDENLVTTTSRFTLVNTFYQMIIDMGRFKSDSFAINSLVTPFEYFYKKNIVKINFEKNKIKNPNIEGYILSRIHKAERGIQYKLINRE